MIPIKYQNNRGDSVDLYGNGIVCSPTEIMGWDLDADDLNGKIASFSTGVVSNSLSVATYSPQARQRLFDIPAFDREDMKPGRLYVGDWYISGFLTGASVENWWDESGKAKYGLTFTTDDAYWKRDTTYVYTEREDGGNGLDFPYDFEFDYGYAPSTVVVRNENYLPADALIRMYGEVENPSVEIGDNEYSVNVTLSLGDYVEIDTYEKTVTVHRLDGKVENAFESIQGEYMEGSGSYVFQRIKTGVNDVTWSGTFDFDIVMTERRREPRIYGLD